MPAFQPKSLSDEDVARLLDLCPAELVLVRENTQGAQVWQCPTCGLEVHMDTPTRMIGQHLRPELVNAWS